MLHERIQSAGRPLTTLRDWETRASVRQVDDESVSPGEFDGNTYDAFPRALMPIVQHPLVLERGEGTVKSLLARRLDEYLKFTSALEMDAVIPAASVIGRCHGPFSLSRALQVDIFKIVTDEGYHALCAETLIDGVANLTKPNNVALERPAFLKLYDRETATLQGRQRHLANVFFVIVSETLITGTLVKLPTDPKVFPQVRDVVREHAKDEAMHHGYFARVLGEYWERMTDEDKDFIGPRIAQYILAFLKPEAANIRKWLLDAGFNVAQCNTLLQEAVYGVQQVASLRAAAQSTVQHLKKCGAFENAATADGLLSHNLV